jgi:hypothetical protein
MDADCLWLQCYAKGTVDIYGQHICCHLPYLQEATRQSHRSLEEFGWVYDFLGSSKLNGSFRKTTVHLYAVAWLMDTNEDYWITAVLGIRVKKKCCELNAS